MAQGIAPPPTVIPIQIQGVSAYGSTGGATSIPPAIAVLPTGTLLRGMITGRNPQGQLVLHTEKGDIALKTDIFFKRGIELMIRMEKVHDETTARIITVDGKPFTKYMDSVRNLPPEEDAIFQTPLARQSPTQQTSAPIKQESGVSLPSPPLTPQQSSSQVSARMSAILLTALPNSQMQTASVPPQIMQMMLNAPSGTQLAVKVTQLILPENGAALPLPTPAPASSAPQAALPSSAPLPTATTNASVLPPSLPAAAPVTLPPVSVSLPPLAAPPTASSTTPAPPTTFAMPLVPTAPIPTEAMPAPALPPMLVANQIPPTTSTPPAPNAPLVVPTTAYTVPSPLTTPTTAAPPNAPHTAVPLIPTAGMAVTAYTPAPVGVATLPSQPNAPLHVASSTTIPYATTPVPTPTPVSPPTSATVTPPASNTLPTPTPPIPTPATTSPVVATQPVPLTTPPPPMTTVAPSAPTTVANPAIVTQSTAPSAVTQPTQLSAPSAPTITATVLEGSATTGLTLHSSIGTLRLMSPHPLPVGTQIQFELEYVLPPTAPSGTASAGVAAETSAGRNALEQLAALPSPMAVAIPEAAAFQPRLIPRAGKELTTELVFLISALKGGDIRKWLGEDNLRALEDTKADMLRRISVEFASMRSTLGDEAEPTRWTMYQLPFATGVGIEPLRLYHRENSEKDKDSKARGESGQHFIVDVTFTRIGILQLDGFVKKSTARHSFDLVVRSEKPLEDELKQGIREIFQEAGQITGYDGGVSFRHGQDALFHLPTPETGLTPDSSNQSIVV